MEKPKLTGSEITVRISVTLHDAPDVHTLLAMTPVRERGGLVRLALQRYISSTNHPAGNVEAQIEAISTWLRQRAAASSVESPMDGESIPLKPSWRSDAPADKPEKKLASPHSENDIVSDTVVGPQKNARLQAADDVDSPSVRRWLAT
jgi:hypothetical protein